MRSSLVRRRRVSVFERSFSAALTRFAKDGEVNFDDGTVKAKDGLQMRMDHVASEVGDDDDLCVGLVYSALVDVHITLARRPR